MITRENEIQVKEKRSFFQWINFMIPYLYTLGIVAIISWMLVSSLIFGYGVIKNDPMDFFLQTNTSDTTSLDNTREYSNNTESVNSQNSWLDLIVKPVVASNFNQILFKGIFLLLIWLLLFLVIPVAFKKIKRIKFFNLEFEVEDIEKSAIETVEISGRKAKLMAYLTSDDASGKTIELLNENGIEFIVVLNYFLKEIQKGYSDSLHANFSFQVFNNDIPNNYHDLAAESIESKEAVIRNKIDNDNILKQNSLVFSFKYNNNKYVTVLSSYTYLFDVLDKYLVELLHNTISKNIENIEYMIELTSSDSELA